MTASYPGALKVFSVFHDYSDIIWAHSVNEMHDEILAIETTLGTNPFKGLPYSTFSQAIQALYTSKAAYTHTHVHKSLVGDATGNDHPQYMQISGYPGFSHPVSGQPGTQPGNLVTYAQMKGMGFQGEAQVRAAVNTAAVNLMAGVDASNRPLWGSIARTGPAWRLQAGWFSGATNADGQIALVFPRAYGNCVQAFVASKTPPVPQTGPVMYPAPNGPYAWIEAQLTLYAVSGTEAILQFSHDYSWQNNMWVSFTWMVIGT